MEADIGDKFFTDESVTAADSESPKSLKEKREELERLQRLALERMDAITKKTDENTALLNRAIPKLEKKLEELDLHKKRSEEIRSSLRNETYLDSLSLGDLDGLYDETLHMAEEAAHVTSFLEAGRDAKKQLDLGMAVDTANSVSVTERTPRFKVSEQIIRPVGESPFARYAVFSKLSTDDSKAAYATLLDLRSLKIRLLGVLNDMIYKSYESFEPNKILSIARRIGVREDLVEKNLRMLIDFGNVSTDVNALSEDAKDALALYGFIRKEAEKDPGYAALTIYPFIILDDGRPARMVERYTGLKEDDVTKGAELLIKERLVNKRTEKGEMLYSGKTDKSVELFGLIKKNYRRVRA